MGFLNDCVKCNSEATVNPSDVTACGDDGCCCINHESTYIVHVTAEVTEVCLYIVHVMAHIVNVTAEVAEVCLYIVHVRVRIVNGTDRINVGELETLSTVLPGLHFARTANLVDELTASSRQMKLLVGATPLSVRGILCDR